HHLHPGSRAVDVQTLAGAVDFAALLDQHDAEAAAVLQALADHVDVTRLEDLQGDAPLWKQHRIERKQGNAVVNLRTHAGAPGLAARRSTSRPWMPSKPPLLITTTWSPGCTRAARSSTMPAVLSWTRNSPL